MSGHTELNTTRKYEDFYIQVSLKIYFGIVSMNYEYVLSFPGIYGTVCAGVCISSTESTLGIPGELFPRKQSSKLLTIPDPSTQWHSI